MGYMRHHAIVVTSWSDDAIQLAHKQAVATFSDVSGIVLSVINHYRSFFVPPDGSKFGWEEDQDGDARRAQFIQWLRSQAYEDGSSSLAWVEVQYGDDEGESMVTRHSDEYRKE